MPTPTLMLIGNFFGGLLTKIKLFFTTSPFGTITMIFIGIILVQSLIASFAIGNPEPFKTQFGDRVIRSDSKTYDMVTAYVENGYQVPTTGQNFFTRGWDKFLFYLNLLENVWFWVAVVMFFTWIFEHAHAKFQAIGYALILVLILGLLVNVWDYNFQKDDKMAELHGWDKFKHMGVQLNPIKGLIKLGWESPHFFMKNNPTLNNVLNNTTNQSQHI